MPDQNYRTEPPLVTHAEWLAMQPAAQGFVLYMQSNLPGSELHGLTCPHHPDSPGARAFAEGERRAVLVAQDSEE